MLLRGKVLESDVLRDVETRMDEEKRTLRAAFLALSADCSYFRLQDRWNGLVNLRILR